MSVLQPFNFQKWLDENRDLLKPPVANKNLTPDSDEYIVMVVAGPNARKDYHYNETEEFFYQLEGNITVNVQVDGEVKSLDLGPGDDDCASKSAAQSCSPRRQHRFSGGAQARGPRLHRRAIVVLRQL